MKDFIPAIFFWGGGERWHDNEGVPITFDQDCSVRELLPSFCANKCICIFFVAIPSTSERWMLFVQRTRRSTTLL